MRKPVKIPTVGILAAIPAFLWCGAATSQTAPQGGATAGSECCAVPQSQIQNDQVQLSDVFAGQTLNVVTPSDVVTGTALAVGNAFSGAVEGVPVNIQSNQDLQGNVTADTVVNATQSLGQTTSVATIATGNSGQADANHGGYVTGTFNQNVGAVTVKSNSHIEAPNASAGDVYATSSATANSQGFGSWGGSVSATVNQNSAATVHADGGGYVKYSPGTVNFASTGVANNVTASGSGASMDVHANQNQTGQYVLGASFAVVNNGQSVGNSATAVANNVAAQNSGGGMHVQANQNNTSYVRAQAVTSTYDFGASATQAYGVGNSTMANETGPELRLDNAQTNSGGVEVIASADGHNGYDMTASATAMGNAVSGTVCNPCGGVMNVNNSQVNSNGVSATSSVNVTGSNRSVGSSAMAVGNSASFYVTQPSGGH